jgi:hypothetical protein
MAKFPHFFQLEQQELYVRSLTASENQLDMQRICYDRLWSQRKLIQAELVLSQKSYRRDSQLFVAGVIPESDI